MSKVFLAHYTHSIMVSIASVILCVEFCTRHWCQDWRLAKLLCTCHFTI